MGLSTGGNSVHTLTAPSFFRHSPASRPPLLIRAFPCFSLVCGRPQFRLNKPIPSSTPPSHTSFFATVLFPNLPAVLCALKPTLCHHPHWYCQCQCLSALCICPLSGGCGNRKPFWTNCPVFVIWLDCAFILLSLALQRRFSGFLCLLWPGGRVGLYVPVCRPLSILPGFLLDLCIGICSVCLASSWLLPTFGGWFPT